MSVDLRRLRLSPILQKALWQNRLHAGQFIQPYFVVEGLLVPEVIPGLTENFRHTAQSIINQIEKDQEQGVRQGLFFFVPAEKREVAPLSNLFALECIRSIKKHFGSDFFIWADVCLCSATTSGHCGFLSEDRSCIDNDRSVTELQRFALDYARAGIDGLAPSDMMDGRVASLRQGLVEIGRNEIPIMSYAAKFHSNFYGPFRGAADSSPKGLDALPEHLKNRSTYQIAPLDARGAWRAVERDLREGADLVMVKPGLPYLDILVRMRENVSVPTAVYEVSGEYAAVESLARDGLISREKAHLESWSSFVRAGADLIISYGARHVNEWTHNFQ